MSDLPTPAEVVTITVQIQTLPTQGREALLYALVGRMLILDIEGLKDDIGEARRLTTVR